MMVFKSEHLPDHREGIISSIFSTECRERELKFWSGSCYSSTSQITSRKTLKLWNQSQYNLIPLTKICVFSLLFGDDGGEFS